MESKIKNIAFLLVGLWSILFLLYLGSNIIFPFIFSFFTSLALLPVVNLLIRWKVSNFISVLIVVLTLTLFFIALVFYSGIEGYQLLDKFSVKEIEKGTKNMYEDATDRVSKKLHIKDEQVKSSINYMLSSSEGAAVYILDSLKNMFAFLAIMPIYVFFMLYYRSNLIYFLKSVPDYQSNRVKVDVVHKIKEMTQKYLLGLFTVIIIVSILNSISLLFFKIDYAIFIGFISGLLMIIPYIGISIGALIPIVIALITKDSLFYPIGIAISYLVIQFIEANFITPKIVGEAINLNPLVIIIGMIIFGTVGGVIGMIVCIPCLASIKIMLDHSSSLRHYALLLTHKVK